MGYVMKKKIISLAFVLFCSNANAAFYFKTTDGDKLTVSKDISTAVYVDSNGEFQRYKKQFIITENIDNYGRPYNSVLFLNEKCQKIESCDSPSLSLKTYTDKSGGASIIFAEKNLKTLKVKDVNSGDISQD